VLQDVRSGSMDVRSAAPLLLGHLQLMFRNYSNLGRGHEFWSMGQRRRRAPARGLGDDGDGFIPVNTALTGSEAAEYARRLAKVTAQRERPTRVNAILERELDRLAVKIAEAGAEAIFVAGPMLSPTRLTLPTSRAGTKSVTLFFDEPKRFPELYAPQHRYDAQHLNATGAELFSVLLADAVAEHLTEGAAPPAVGAR
jgi:hypothetical protein